MEKIEIEKKREKLKIEIYAVGNTGRCAIKKLSELGNISNRTLFDTDILPEDEENFDEAYRLDLNDPLAVSKQIQDTLFSSQKVINGHKRVAFIIGRLGRETGGSFMPLLTSTAKDAGIYTIGFGVLPMMFEGSVIRHRAIDSFNKIIQTCDMAIKIDTEHIAQSNPSFRFIELFEATNDSIVAQMKDMKTFVANHLGIPIE